MAGLLTEREVLVTTETVRGRCRTLGQGHANAPRRRPRAGNTWPLAAVFISIQGFQHSPRRAVDQGGTVRTILVEGRRNLAAARKFCRRLRKELGSAPRAGRPRNARGAAKRGASATPGAQQSRGAPRPAHARARATAAWPVVRTLCATAEQAAAAYAGLVPRPRASGTGGRGRPSSGRDGNGHPRSALSMATLRAAQHNPAISPCDDRLRGADKPKQVARGANARTPLHRAWAVGTTRQPCDPG